MLFILSNRNNNSLMCSIKWHTEACWLNTLAVNDGAIEWKTDVSLVTVPADLWTLWVWHNYVSWMRVISMWSAVVTTHLKSIITAVVQLMSFLCQETNLLDVRFSISFLSVNHRVEFGMQSSLSFRITTSTILLPSKKNQIVSQLIDRDLTQLLAS